VVTLELSDSEWTTAQSQDDIREYARVSFLDFGARFGSMSGDAVCRVESIEPGPRRWSKSARSAGSKSAPGALMRFQSFAERRPLWVVVLSAVAGFLLASLFISLTMHAS
jgi:hypothetical protein